MSPLNSSTITRNDFGFREEWDRGETVIETYRRSVKVRRRQGHRHTREVTWKRNNIGGYSKNSQRNLRFQILESRIKQEIGLTFPSGCVPKDAKELEKVIRGIRDYLRKFCFASGFIVIEFKRRKRSLTMVPHLHLLIDTRVAEERIFRNWAKIIGSQGIPKKARYCVNISQGRQLMHRANYVSKRETKQVPDHYIGIKRLWRRFGTRFEPLSEDVKSNREALLEFRLLRLLQKARCRMLGKRIPKCNGYTGGTFYDCSIAFDKHWPRYKALFVSGEDTNQAMPDYADSLCLSISKVEAVS